MVMCVVLCALALFSVSACNRKEKTSPRVWLIAPQSMGAEQEIRALVEGYDSEATVSFVPVEEIDTRVAAALKQKNGPDVFMLHADAIPDLAEKEMINDLSTRLRTGRVKSDELSEAARRACLYQGKTWGVPMFVDVYMLACNRELVSTVPETIEALKETCAALEEKGVASFEKLSPHKQSLFYEAVVKSYGGEMLNGRNTELAFVSEAGKNALDDCVEIFRNSANGENALGEGEAAFSIYTAMERRITSEKYADTEIALGPLFGLERLQTVALATNPDSKVQSRMFGVLEFLQENTEKLAALYKTYAAREDIKPLTAEDREVAPHITQARPQPDLCGYESLLDVYLPAALTKASKGVNAADALKEAADSASSVIWPGKRE